MTTRQERRQIVLELVNQQTITSQEQLQELLQARGIRATQATISRDLRDLGVIKTPSRSGGSPVYALVDLEREAGVESQELKIVLRSDVRTIERAGSLLVMKTREGAARSVAARLDRSGMPQIVGVIAGHEAVFVATRSPGQAGELRRLLIHLRD